MSGGLDYVRMGELLVRADRAEAKLKALSLIGDAMADHLQGLGRTAGQLRAEWLDVRAWDGCPVHRGMPGAHRKGAQGE